MILEAGVVGEDVSGQQPEPPVEAVEKIVGLDADFLDNLLVEIVQELFTRVFLTLGDLGFELALKLVELELDLLGRAALLVDGGDAFLEIDAGVDRAEPSSLAPNTPLNRRNFSSSSS